jgi:ABC-type Fe3+/spermidine/putrescine transport system ATPase subunit
MEKIEVKNVVKKYGNVLAIDDVSFSVKEGEILSLLGPSGCGKTTVLRAIAGLEDIDYGEILLDGEIITSPKKKTFVSPEKRLLGLVFQSYALWPHMKVKDNVSYGLKVRKFGKGEIDKRVKSALETVGLSGLENRFPAQLSGGQQQRVALARNIAYEPKVLLLDEPLSNLDRKVRDRMRGELHVLLKRIGVTAVYVTHDQEEAFVISDRIILMKDGKIVQEAKPKELYEEPKCTFAAEFIGRANILKAIVKAVDDKKKTARLEMPELGGELMCKYDCDIFPKDTSQVLVRYNEIAMYESEPPCSDNVFKGEVVSRDYRGSVTDHKVNIGSVQMIVTTHKFCTMSRSTEKKDVYIYIPPEAVRPLAVEEVQRQSDSAIA